MMAPSPALGPGRRTLHRSSRGGYRRVVLGFAPITISYIGCQIHMRTLVDLPDDDLRELAELARRNKQSRASLVREAVAAFLASHRHRAGGDAFGLWGTKRLDGVTYQRKIRSEW